MIKMGEWSIALNGRAVMKVLLLLQVASLSLSEILSGLRAVDRMDFSNARSQCAFHFEGLDELFEVEDPRVYLAIACDKDVLLNTTILLSEATETHIGIEGTTIFSEAAYLSIQNTAMFDMQRSLFMNLPPLPRALGGSVAPIVINNTKMEISNTVMSGNLGFDISGGLIVTGNSNVDIEGSNFTDCQGGKVGVIVMEEDATVIAHKCLFNKNSGISLAGSISASGRSKMTLSESNFSGGSEDMLGWKPYGDSVVLMGFSPKAGAVALQDTSFGRIDDCIFSNHSGIHGTVYAAHESTLKLSRSVFQENFIAFGGGVFVDGQIRQTTQVEGCTFEGNTAQSGGALVLLGATSFSVKDCAFLYNRATKSGGAFYSDSTHPNVTDYTACSKATEGNRIPVDSSQFLSNVAEDSGGAIYSKCTHLVASNIKIDHNSAGDYGGGVFIDTGLGFETKDSSQFTGNSAGKGGSAIYALMTTTLDIKSSLFKGNSVHGTVKGGTIAAHAVDHVILLNLTVEDNTSMRGSAGLEVEDADRVNITMCMMTRNSGANGGAFAGINVTEVTIQGTTVQENKANSGGAFVLSKVSQAAIKSSKFSRNQAKLADGGGLILMDSGDFLVDDVTFEENAAKVSCGAIKIDVAGKVNILKGLFFSNAGISGLGGAVCIHKVDTFSTDPSTNLTSNTCANGGGALDVLSSKTLNIQGTTFSQNRAKVGAAIAANDIKIFMLKNVKSLKNQASVGGIIDAQNAESFQAVNGVIQDNQGSGINLSWGNSASISGTKIVGNTAKNGGGMMILSYSTKVELHNATLKDNKAMEDGGAIYSDGIPEFTVVNTVITGNTASKEGGAMIVIGNRNVTISNSSLSKNVADGSGGGFVCEAESMVYVAASTFSYNYARKGQSITAKCNCQVSITGSVFKRDVKRRKNGDFFKRGKKCAAISYTNSLFIGPPRRGLAWWWILLIVVLCLIALSLCLLCFAPKSWRLHLKIMMLRGFELKSNTPNFETEAVPLVHGDEVDDNDGIIVPHPINVHGERTPEIQEELPLAGPSGEVHSEGKHDDGYYSGESSASSHYGEKYERKYMHPSGERRM